MSVIVIFRKLASKYGNVSVIENLNVLVNSHPTFQESKRTQTCYFSNETTTLTDFTTHTVTFQTQQLEVFNLSQTNSLKHLAFLQIMAALYSFQTQQLEVLNLSPKNLSNHLSFLQIIATYKTFPSNSLKFSIFRKRIHRNIYLFYKL